jgi:hypothetical protein
MMSYKLVPLLLVSLLMPFFAMADSLLTEKGKALAEIVVDGDKTPPQITFAAEELQNWIGKISGAKMEILKAPGAAKIKIYLGTPEFSPAIRAFTDKRKDDIDKMNGNDGFAIRTSGNNIYIYAVAPKGVLNGVYRFLEKNSDIIFVRAMEAENGFGTIYTQTPDFNAKFTDTLDIPKFTTRFWTGDVASYTWQARNLGAGSYGIEHIGSPEMFNGLNKVGTQMPWQGGFQSIFPQNIYTSTHPEFYPMIDGKRRFYDDCQLCFTNPEMIKEYIAKLDEVIKNSPRRVTSFGIGHGDNWDLCQCPGCMKPIELPGGVVVNPKDEDFRSVQYFMFVNKVADMVMKKYPGKKVSTLAYLWCAQSPRLKLLDNVEITYCPYVKDHKIPITATVNKKWLERFVGWPGACKNLGLYEYYLCYTTPLFYNPVCDIAAQDFRFYQEKGLKDIYLDVTRCDNNGNMTPNFTNADVYNASAIEFWVAMRLMWDPAQDPEILRDEFCKRAFHEASAPMREYFAKFREVWLKDPAPCYWNDNPVLSARRYIVGNNLSEPLRALLEKAEAKAGHPGSKELVKRQRQVFEKWLELEKRIGKKLELAVPLIANPPEEDFTLSKGDWANALVIDGFRFQNRPDLPEKVRTEVKILHDKQNLYIGFRCYENDMTKVKDYKLVSEKDKWFANPYYIEMFFDGDQRDKGGYYHICFDANESIYDALGYDNKWNCDWKVKTAKLDDCWAGIVKLPLKSIGVNISMGNKIGAMFCRDNGTAWRGGNVHQSAGFQDLILKMD